MNWNLANAVALSAVTIKPLQEENKKLKELLTEIAKSLEKFQESDGWKQWKEFQNTPLDIFYNEVVTEITKFDDLNLTK